MTSVVSQGAEINGTERDQMERSDHVAIEIENPYASLTTSIDSELNSLRSLDDECTIHRVIETLRQLDEKAYTPRMVSIGPIHHGREDLKAMEEYKRRYLKTFLQRTEAHAQLKDFIKVIKENEKKVRMRYAETIELNSDDFVKMILMDAAFIFEVLLMFSDNEYPRHDHLFGSPCKKYGVFDDLYMLENQLPFFILEALFILANISRSSDKGKVLLLKITHKLTKHRWGYLGIEESFSASEFSRVKHLVDFLRICIVPSSGKSKQKDSPPILTTPSVTELHQAGVKFKLRSSSKNLFDITFENGILEIPRITIRSPLENMMKNLLAFEQSQCGSLLNDYVILMNYLVNTPKDVELLVQHEIIHNPIGDCELASTLFHRLVERPTFRPDHFFFSTLIKDLNQYCRRPWHKWKATLKQDYFKTPWTTISVIAAVILLVLTFIQTYCSILQVKQEK